MTSTDFCSPHRACGVVVDLRPCRLQWEPGCKDNAAGQDVARQLALHAASHAGSGALYISKSLSFFSSGFFTSCQARATSSLISSQLLVASAWPSQSWGRRKRYVQEQQAYRFAGTQHYQHTARGQRGTRHTTSSAPSVPLCSQPAAVNTLLALPLPHS